MKTPKFETALVLTIALGMVLPILIVIVSGIFIAKDLRIENVLFHSILEIAGAVIALLIAGILMFKKQKVFLNSLWMICAFMSMGIFDLVHALTIPGNTFVWLHSLAVFFGGLFFSLLWLPIFKNTENFEKVRKSKFSEKNFAAISSGNVNYAKFSTENNKFQSKIILGITFLLVSGIALLSWLYPSLVPLMVVNGNFTLFANLLNIIGGVLFLIAAFYFINEYSRVNSFGILIFAILCSLFGAAGILFSFSALWEINWWSWHILRVVAYLFAIFYILRKANKKIVWEMKKNEN